MKHLLPVTMLLITLFLCGCEEKAAPATPVDQHDELPRENYKQGNINTH